jgi:ADP-heptose:LPS heptosyltransferase/GT2 family glycosyltransferase
MPDTLVIQWARLGDLLHSRPILDKLKRECPADRLCFTFDARYQAIAERFPETDQLFPVAIEQVVAHCRSDVLLAEAVEHFVEDTMTGSTYRLVINLTNHPAAIYFARLVNSESRIGYGFESGSHWTELLESRIEDSPSIAGTPKHISDIWCSCVTNEIKFRYPAPLVSKNQAASRDRVAIICDAGDPKRSLSEASIQTLVECAVDAGVKSITLLGAHKPHLRIPNTIDLRGSTSLNQLYEILEDSDGAIGPDTGALHLAAALDCKVFGIYLNDAHPVRTGPYTLNAQCVITDDQDASFQMEARAIVSNWLKRCSVSSGTKVVVYVPHFRNGNLFYERLDRPTRDHSCQQCSLTVIVTEYGQTHYTDSLLADLSKCNLPAGSEIIVVSSGMCAADSAYAKARDSVVAIASERPLSFAQANNLGANNARNTWLLLINDDCQISPAAFAELWSSRKHGSVTAPRLKYWDEVTQSCGIEIRDAEVHDIDASNDCDYRKQNDSQIAVSAAALLIEKNLFDKHGGFDEQYVNGYEDVDFCLRVNASGSSIELANCDVLHYRSSSEGRFAYEDKNLKLLEQKWPMHFVATPKRDIVEYHKCPLLFISDSSASEAGPTIRWISPLERLGLTRGIDFEWVETSAVNELQLSDLLHYTETAFIFRSIGNSTIRSKVLEWKRNHGKRLMHDCDDLLLNRFALDSSRGQSRQVFEHGVRELITAANICISPSRRLLEMHGVNDTRQYELPSVPMPEHFVDRTSERNVDVFRIGYAGGVSHHTDLALVLPVLEELLDAHENLRFYWWGAHPGKLSQHPSVRRGGMWLKNYRQHLNRIQRVPIDLWLAPLADTPHNQMRSPIKVFEYIGCKRQALFSKCEPFSKVCSAADSSILVENNLPAWRARIESMIVGDQHDSMNWNSELLRYSLETISRDLSGYSKLLKSLDALPLTQINMEELCLA